MSGFDTKVYWAGKEGRRDSAIKYVKFCKEFYASQIKSSIEKTKIYSPKTPFPVIKSKDIQTEIAVTGDDSVSAVFKYAKDGKSAVLNFASFKNPGGMFVNGSKAQEECLCAESNLFNVLRSFDQTFYEENRKHLNKALYNNRALYSPDIVFSRKNADILEFASIPSKENETILCDVITCACPNKTTATKYNLVSEEENKAALTSRIDFVLNIAASQEVDTLILGGYGCGVFGQNPKEVASIFKEFLETKYKNVFKRVIFAIYKASGRDENYNNFKKVFM